MNVGRRAALAAGTTTLLGLRTPLAAAPAVRPRHVVLLHGAWHGGWAWGRVMPMLVAAGHEADALTFSGLGERSHVAAGTSGLAVHVQDVVSHLFMYDLRDVVLVGHSYAGCVLSGVLAQRTGRIGHAVYLDAFVPAQGQCMADFVPAPVRADFEKLARADGLVSPPPPPSWGERWGLSDPALIAWAQPRMTAQAARSFVETVQGDPFQEGVRFTYLKCTENPNPGFKAIAAGLRKDLRFDHADVQGHHDVMLTDPARLTEALLKSIA